MYSDTDLELLEQIIALKFLGIPLKKIVELLDRQSLGDALELQRQALEQRRTLLDRAIQAIQASQRAMENGRPASSEILKRIIEVIDMQDSVEAMKRYYSNEAAWARRKRYYTEGPAPEWQELYRDVNKALGEDPGSEPLRGGYPQHVLRAFRESRGLPRPDAGSTRGVSEHGMAEGCANRTHQRTLRAAQRF